MEGSRQCSCVARASHACSVAEIVVLYTCLRFLLKAFVLTTVDTGACCLMRSCMECQRMTAAGTTGN